MGIHLELLLPLQSLQYAPSMFAGVLATSLTAQKMKFSIKDFFNKCDQIFCKLRKKLSLGKPENIVRSIYKHFF